MSVLDAFGGDIDGQVRLLDIARYPRETWLGVVGLLASALVFTTGLMIASVLLNPAYIVPGLVGLLVSLYDLDRTLRGLDHAP